MSEILVRFLILLYGRLLAESVSVKDRLNNSASISALDDFVRELMECRQIPGLVLSVVDKDSDIFQREYGFANIRESRPMTEHTRVCVASLSKAFSSALLGKLLNSTEYTWDTPISRIFPEARFPDPYVTEHVTIRDILSHRTGIDTTFDELWYLSVHNQTELFRRIHLMPYKNSFRSAAFYNNIIYSLSGAISETLAGNGLRQSSWEDLLETHILHPLGMHNTSFYHRRNDPSMFATPYSHVKDDEAAEPHPTEININLTRGMKEIAASIALCTTSSDIALWMKCLLSAMADDGCQTIPREIITSTTAAQVLADRMFHSHIHRPRTSVSMIVTGYGLGWFLGYYRDRRFLMHYGSIPGSYSMLILVPEMNLGIFLSYNGALQMDPFTIGSMIVTYILDQALGYEPWISDPQKACLFPNDDHLSPPVLSPTVSPHVSCHLTDEIIASCVGVFSHPLMGEVRVTYDKPRLLLHYGCVETELVNDVNVSDSVESTNFLAFPVDEAWLLMLPPIDVSFSKCENENRSSAFTYLTLSFLSDRNNMKFVRIGEPMCFEINRPLNVHKNNRPQDACVGKQQLGNDEPSRRNSGSESIVTRGSVSRSTAVYFTVIAVATLLEYL